MQYESINKNREFARIYKKGKCIVHSECVLYYKKNNYNKIRVGITASKKIGNAVKRNRARRVLRYALQEVLPQCTDFYDFVLVARGKTVYLKSTKLEKTLYQILYKEGLLQVQEK